MTKRISFDASMDSIRKAIIQIYVAADVDIADEVEIILHFPHPRYDRKVKVSSVAFLPPEMRD